MALFMSLARAAPTFLVQNCHTNPQTCKMHQEGLVNCPTEHECVTFVHEECASASYMCGMGCTQAQPHQVPEHLVCSVNEEAVDHTVKVRRHGCCSIRHLCMPDSKKKSMHQTACVQQVGQLAFFPLCCLSTTR